MLRLDGVFSGYDNKLRLFDISLKFEQGDFVVIVGPNGAGKSTLLKTISGILSVSQGRIVLDGLEIMNLSTDVLAKKGISYVPQGRVVFPNLTVDENIRVGGFLLSNKKLESRLVDIYSLFPSLEKRKDSLSSSLSGGQQQMVSIARSLILKPKVLLLDEPSSGLAPLMVRNLFEKLVEINNSGTCVVLVEQNVSSAVKLASKIVVLDQGKIALDGGKELVDSPRIKELCLGY